MRACLRIGSNATRVIACTGGNDAGAQHGEKCQYAAVGEPSPEQATLWPSEIQLTDKYYLSLKDHAVPFDFRALRAIQNKPRAQDIYLWMTQRLCRIETGKPLLIRWQELHEMFGGQTPLKELAQFIAVCSSIV